MATHTDTLILDYSIHRKVLTPSAGVLKPIINELISPIVFTPKQTEQRWILRAPYEKTLTIYYRFIDLLAEEECSKSSIKLLDDKGHLLLNVCDRRSHDLANTNLSDQRLLQSTTNEVTLSFQTHNYNEIVYWLDEQNRPVAFRGYELFYAFDEPTGDCYFQKRSDLKCGYTDVSGAWSIALPETTRASGDYNSILCLDCYLKAEIPLSKNLTQVVESPLISRNKQFLRFSYRLTDTAPGQV